MLREMNPVAPRRSRRDFRKQVAIVPACILCRVLWPLAVQHRHLLFDSSSEANTVLVAPKRPQEPNRVRGCSHQSPA